MLLLLRQWGRLCCTVDPCRSFQNLALHNAVMQNLCCRMLFKVTEQHEIKDHIQEYRNTPLQNIN